MYWFLADIFTLTQKIKLFPLLGLSLRWSLSQSTILISFLFNAAFSVHFTSCHIFTNATHISCPGVVSFPHSPPQLELDKAEDMETCNFCVSAPLHSLPTTGNYSDWTWACFTFLTQKYSFTCFLRKTRGFLQMYVAPRFSSDIKSCLSTESGDAEARRGGRKKVNREMKWEKKMSKRDESEKPTNEIVPPATRSLKHTCNHPPPPPPPTKNTHTVPRDSHIHTICPCVWGTI